LIIKVDMARIQNVQIILSLLKQFGISKVVASPGTQNMSLVTSMDRDPFFEVYSAADERSAAYIACGMAAETGEAVVLSCTGATASRNYIPGLTEAFYRHLPIVAITSTERVTAVGHNIAQVIDRGTLLNDIAKMSVLARCVDVEDDEWDCLVQVNKALLELNHHGRGPVHINLEKSTSEIYSVEQIPVSRKIGRVCLGDDFPELDKGKIAIFIGSHTPFSELETQAIDRFCGKYNAVVFCDHTSNYKGKYRILPALIASQMWNDSTIFKVDTLIQLGDISGEYYEQSRIKNDVQEVWRVNADGEVRDQFRKLHYVFEMNEVDFFNHYAGGEVTETHVSYLKECREEYKKVYDNILELPFSNLWMAQQLSTKLPANAVLHMGILNSLRSWNFFEVPDTILSFSNVGGFGIDGGLSSFIGGSLGVPQKLHFCVIGDLAFFYDMNALGNRHIGNNVRILLVNNGVGTEFKLYQHPASKLGSEANRYIAAGGHYGRKSPELVRHYAEALGFEYHAVSSKQGFQEVLPRLVTTESLSCPIFVEVFTEEERENEALWMINNIVKSNTNKRKEIVKKVLGESVVRSIRKIVGGTGK
jgi:hypothetical protein